MVSASPIERAVANLGAADFIKSLTDRELAELAYSWELWARPSQLAPPGDWLTWLVMAGRGFGKNRLAAEWLRRRVDNGEARRIAIVGRTPADVRDVMVEGESGILAVFPPGKRPLYEPSKRRVTFHTGAIGTVYSSENPEQLRGPQHDTALIDELGTFKSARAWDNLQLGLRLGVPKQVVTTTPRPTRTIKELVDDPTTIVTGGTTYENRANLAPAFFRQVIRKYEGTRIGQQELMGVLFDDVPGALWNRDIIHYRAAPDLTRVVIGVDPSVGDGDNIAECGIIAVGQGTDGFFYVLNDYSLRASPHVWASQVVKAYYMHEGYRIVAEVNNGGELVELTVRTVDENVSYRDVRASVSNEARAEPVAALYEQGRVFHVKPFQDLEDQLCLWVPGQGESPDRLDALVWAFHDLALRPAWNPVIV